MNDATKLFPGVFVTEVKRVEICAEFEEKFLFSSIVFQTLMHEIGHNLGLDHSNVRGSVMWPRIIRRPPDFVLKLQPDDVRRIQALYGAGTGTGGVQILPPEQPTGSQVKAMLCIPVQSQTFHHRLCHHHRLHGPHTPQEACHIRQHIRLGLTTLEAPDIDGPITPKGQHIVRITLEGLIILERLLKLICCRQAFRIYFPEV